MSDSAALVDRAGQLCRVIARQDLVGHELYIIRQSAISAEFGTAEGCEAYTSQASTCICGSSSVPAGEAGGHVWF